MAPAQRGGGGQESVSESIEKSCGWRREKGKRERQGDEHVEDDGLDRVHGWKSGEQIVYRGVLNKTLDRVDSVSSLVSETAESRSELGYGTPYLLSLGLSEQLTSLVWLAGPISGLVAQPLIGAISDSSQSRFRRRYWIVTATMLLVFSGLGLAFTEPIAKALVDLFGGGQGDWDPRNAQLVSIPGRGRLMRAG